MKRDRMWLLIVAGALLLVLLVGLNLRRVPAPVSVLTVRSTAFVNGLPESGIVQYPQIRTISSKIAANIGHIFVKPGDRVRAGQLLLTMESTQILSSAQTSEAAYHSATARAAGAQIAGRTNIVQAQANLESARARLEQAREDLANGLQSGLGFGETTAANESAQANANVAQAATDLREAQRLYSADRNLYANEAISLDQLDQAKAKLEQAQVAYERAIAQRTALGSQLRRSRSVLEDNVWSAQEGFAQAQTQLAAAREQAGTGDVVAAQADAARASSEYAFAREQADATQVRAPYDAIVLSVAKEKNDQLRPLQPGDAVEQGQPLVIVARQRGFLVRTKVDEQDIAAVHIGQTAVVTGEDIPGRSLSGRIVEISPIAERSGDARSATRTVETTIAIDRPPAYLRDGMTVEVKIITADVPHAIVVPNEAIAGAGDATYVYVVRDGSTHRQAVHVAAANEKGTVIASGLHDGDVIVAQNVAGGSDP